MRHLVTARKIQKKKTSKIHNTVIAENYSDKNYYGRQTFIVPCIQHVCHAQSSD